MAYGKKDAQGNDLKLRLAAVAVEHYLNAKHPENLMAFWLVFGASILPDHTVRTALEWIDQGRDRSYVAKRLMYRIKRYRPRNPMLPSAKGWAIMGPIIEHLRTEFIRSQDGRIRQLFYKIQEIAHLRPKFYALLVRAAWEEWGKADLERFFGFVQQILRDFPEIEQREQVYQLSYGYLRPEGESVSSLKFLYPSLRSWNLKWLTKAIELGQKRLAGLDLWLLEGFLDRPRFMLMHVGEKRYGSEMVRWVAFGRARMANLEGKYFVLYYSFKNEEGVALIRGNGEPVNVYGPVSHQMLRQVAAQVMPDAPMIVQWVRPLGENSLIPEKARLLGIPRFDNASSFTAVRATLEALR